MRWKMFLRSVPLPEEQNFEVLEVLEATEGPGTKIINTGSRGCSKIFFLSLKK
jgi:hypothetical protein